MSKFAKDCLSQKSILITGGLGAIGKVVVGHLLDHSARVLVNDILPEAEARKIIAEAKWSADRCLHFGANVTKASDVQALVDRTVSAFGQVDVALSHAGMIRSCPIIDCGEQEWDKTLDLNLKGAFLVAQAAARSMVKQKVKGKIVLTSSTRSGSPSWCY